MEMSTAGTSNTEKHREEQEEKRGTPTVTTQDLSPRLCQRWGDDVRRHNYRVSGLLSLLAAELKIKNLGESNRSDWN